MTSKKVIVIKEKEHEVGKAFCRWFTNILQSSCSLWIYNEEGSIKGEDGREKRFEDTEAAKLFIFLKELNFSNVDGKSVNLLREIWKFQRHKDSPFSHSILLSFDNQLELLKQNFNENNLILSDRLHIFKIPFSLKDVEMYLLEIENKHFIPTEKYLDAECSADTHLYRNLNAVVDFLKDAGKSGKVPIDAIKGLQKKLHPWSFSNWEIDNINTKSDGLPLTGDKILLIDDTKEWEIILKPIFASKGWELKSYEEWNEECKKSLKDDFDIRMVLLDMVIGDKEKEGEKILEEIRKERPHIPVVLFSVSDPRTLFGLFKEGNVDDLYFKEDGKGQYNKLLTYVKDNIKISKVVEPFQQRINNLEHYKDESTHYKLLLFYLEQSAEYLKKALRVKLDIVKLEQNNTDREKIEKLRDEQLKPNIKASMYFSGLVSEKTVNILPYIKGFPADTKGWEEQFEVEDKIEEKDKEKKEGEDKEKFYPYKQYRTIAKILRNFVAHPAVSIEHFEVDDALIFLSIALKMAEHYCFSKSDNPSILSFIDISNTNKNKVIEALKQICSDEKELRLPESHADEISKLREIIGNALGMYIKEDKNRKPNAVWNGLAYLPFNNPYEKYYLQCVPYLADFSYMEGFMEGFEENKKNIDEEDQSVYALIAGRINEDNILNNYLKPNDEDKS